MSENDFDPRRYLTKLSGRDYLEVKWRLLWLRTVHPDAVVLTDLFEHREGAALFRAEVRLAAGGSATGWGSETAEDFGDYIEKAETKALGRALAALGFGTQFCEDFSFGADAGRVVDAPVLSRADGPPADGASPPANGASARRRGPRVTEPQLHAIYAIGRDRRWTPDEVQTRCREAYGRPPEELGRREASSFIDALRGEAAVAR